MYPDVSINRCRVIEVEDKIAIAQLNISSLAWISKLGGLPRLAFILTEVLNYEGFHVVDREKPLTSGVDGKASKITGYPAPAKFLSNNSSCAAATKAIQYNIIFIG